MTKLLQFQAGNWHSDFKFESTQRFDNPTVYAL